MCTSRLHCLGMSVKLERNRRWQAVRSQASAPLQLLVSVVKAIPLRVGRQSVQGGHGLAAPGAVTGMGHEPPSHLARKSADDPYSLEADILRLARQSRPPL